MRCAAAATAACLQNGYDYGCPDYVDILPPSCSGLCLAAVINLCFVVLTYLQPQSPARAVVPRGRGGRSAAQPQQTLNNPNGFVWGPYGGLQHVPAADADDDDAGADAQPARRGVVGDGLADVVHAAISGASGFLGSCWGRLKAAGEAGC
uniref:Uncharacterized protein n=1 Tax=Tetradesmus obliquus TaxID=3088 RepID=A0A383WP04_TETOB|eukprot:jgi/Sobl393_1/17673/SZX78894.1